MSTAGESLIHLAAWLAQNAVNLTIQSTILIVIGFAAARLFAARGSAVQSAIYRATLAAVMLCPVIAIAFQVGGIDGWSVPLPPASSTIGIHQVPFGTATQPPDVPRWGRDDSLEAAAYFNPSLTGVTGSPGVGRFQGDDTAAELAGRPHATSPDPRLPPAFVEKQITRANLVLAYIYIVVGLAWTLAAGCLIVRLLRACRKLNRLRNQSLPGNARERALCSRLARRMQVQAPDVRRNSLLASPCLIGLRSPAILLPIEIQTADSLERAFAHELAHLRRHDIWWNFLQRTALAIFCFQPLMWRLVYRLETTAEEVCDDDVVSHCADRAGYASQLVALAESNLLASSLAGLGMFRSKTALERRVQRILDTTRGLTTQVSRRLVTVIVAMAAVSATLGGYLGSPGLAPTETPRHAAPRNAAPRNAAPHAQAQQTRSAGSINTAIQEGIPPLPLWKQGDQYVFQGQVVDEKRQPIRDASVRLNTWPRTWHPDNQPSTMAETKSDGQGIFELRVDKSQLGDGDLTADGKFRAGILALAGGFGPDLVLWEDLPDGGTLNFRLMPENAIRGRVVNLQGQPMAGVNVLPLYYDITRQIELTDAWLGALQAGTPWPAARPDFKDRKTVYANSGAFPARLVTDGRGEFQIRGIPRHAHVHLRLEHRQIVTQLLSLVNRRMEPIEYLTHEKSTTKLKLHGDQPRIAARPSRPIVGRVRDAASGDPIPGARILCAEMGIPTTVYGTSAAPQTFSDTNGEFELLGMPNSTASRLIVYPPDNRPYLIQAIDRIPETIGSQPATLEVSLHRGIWIRGKVIDLATGKGVAARITYAPLRDNPSLKDVEPFRGVHRDEHYYFGNYQSQPDGRFSVAGLPGPAVLGASHPDPRKYRKGVGYQRLLDTIGTPYSADQVRQMIEMGDDATGKKFIDTAMRFAVHANSPDTMLLIDPPAGGEPMSYELSLDPGTDVEIRVVDAQGDAVDEIVMGRTTFSGGRVTLKKMGYNETRRIALVNRARSLGAVARISGDPQVTGDKLIRLRECGLIRGRLLDQAGQPISGATVNPNFGETVTSDDNGNFVLRHLATPARYVLEIQKKDSVSFKLLVTDSELQPGQTLDLGEIDVDALAIELISGVGG